MKSLFRAFTVKSGNAVSHVSQAASHISQVVKVPVNVVTKHSLDAANAAKSLFRVVKWSLVLTSAGFLFFGIGYVLNSPLVLRLHQRDQRDQRNQNNIYYEHDDTQ